MSDTIYITATADDAYDNGTTLINDNTTLVVWGDSSVPQETGLRFQAIPGAGKTVKSAILHIYDNTNIGMTANVYGIADDDIAVWAAPGNLPSDATKTATYASFFPVVGWNEVDITLPLQEIVSRPGWFIGNDLAFVIADSASDGDFAIFASYDYDSGSRKPYIIIELVTGLSKAINVDLTIVAELSSAQFVVASSVSLDLTIEADLTALNNPVNVALAIQFASHIFGDLTLSGPAIVAIESEVEIPSYVSITVQNNNNIECETDLLGSHGVGSYLIANNIPSEVELPVVHIVNFLSFPQVIESETEIVEQSVFGHVTLGTVESEADITGSGIKGFISTVATTSDATIIDNAVAGYISNPNVESEAAITSIALSTIIALGIVNSEAEIPSVVFNTIIAKGNIEVEAEILNPDIDTNNITVSIVLYGKQLQSVIFTNYNFNSFIEINGKVYGANADGISLITGTADDNEEVRTGLRINENTFGSSRGRKRIRSMYLGPNNRDARVIGETENSKREVIADRKGKAVVGRSVHGRNLSVEISDFNDLELIDMYITETS